MGAFREDSVRSVDSSTVFAVEGDAVRSGVFCLFFDHSGCCVAGADGEEEAVCLQRRSGRGHDGESRSERGWGLEGLGIRGKDCVYNCFTIALPAVCRT